MPRTFFAYSMVVVLVATPALAQPAGEETRATQPEARRPAGRRLLDEVASERQRGRAEPTVREPDLQPVPPHVRTDKLNAPEAAPVTDAPAVPDRAANYPFDAPLPAQTPAAQKPVAPPPDFAAEDRYARRAAVAAEAPPAVAQTAYEQEPSEVEATVYNEPLQAKEQPPVHVPDAIPQAAAANELATAVEATPRASEQPAAEPGLPLAPRGEQDAGADAVGAKKPFGDAKSPLTTMVGSLGLVLAIFFALVWVMRRAAPASLRPMPSEVVEVLGRAPLPGKQQQMHLVRCGRKLLLLASSPTGFTTLTEVTDESEVDRLVGLCRGELPRLGPSKFQQSFSEPAHDSFGRGYGEESIDSAAAALARRLSRSSRLGGSDD